MTCAHCRVEGVVEKVPVEESTEYFHSRPRGSQIGAWVSNQSQPVQDRGVLDARWVQERDGGGQRWGRIAWSARRTRAPGCLRLGCRQPTATRKDRMQLVLKEVNAEGQINRPEHGQLLSGSIPSRGALWHMQPCSARCGSTQPCRARACYLCLMIGCWKQAPETTLCPCVRYTELMDKYADESVPVPRPEHWGGYLIRPTAIEFWQGRPSRVHDRIVFRRAAPGEGQPWVMERLQP